MSAKLLPEIDLNLCNGCGKCAQGCPRNVLVMRKNLPVFEHPLACTFCARCEELCADNLIRCAFEITWDSPSSNSLNNQRSA